MAKKRKAKATRRPGRRTNKTKSVSRTPKVIVPLAALKLPVSLEGVLTSHGIDSANELSGYLKSELMQLPNVGLKSVEWIRERLKAHGFGFGVAGAKRKAAAMLLDDDLPPTDDHAPVTPSRPTDPRLEQPAEMKTRIIEIEVEPKDFQWLTWRAGTWGTTVKHVLKKMIREYRAADHTRAGQAITDEGEVSTVPERDYQEGHQVGVRGGQGFDDGL